MAIEYLDKDISVDGDEYDEAVRKSLVAQCGGCCDNGQTRSPLGRISTIGLSFDSSLPS